MNPISNQSETKSPPPVKKTLDSIPQQDENERNSSSIRPMDNNRYRKELTTLDQPQNDLILFYDGSDTHRNINNNTPTQHQHKMYEQFFKEDGVVRRSSSLADLRIDKKGFDRNHNQSTMHNPAGSYEL